MLLSLVVWYCLLQSRDCWLVWDSAILSLLVFMQSWLWYHEDLRTSSVHSSLCLWLPQLRFLIKLENFFPLLGNSQSAFKGIVLVLGPHWHHFIFQIIFWTNFSWADFLLCPVLWQSRSVRWKVCAASGEWWPAVTDWVIAFASAPRLAEFSCCSKAHSAVLLPFESPPNKNLCT